MPSSCPEYTAFMDDVTASLLRNKRNSYLLGVLEVFEESVLVPSDALVHVGSGVGVAVGLTGLATEDTGCEVNNRHGESRQEGNSPVKVGADLVGLARADSVALRAAGLEEGSTLGGVTGSERHGEA